jgi:hypothetical protein
MGKTKEKSATTSGTDAPEAARPRLVIPAPSSGSSSGQFLAFGLIACLVVGAVAWKCQENGLEGDFVFDDEHAVINNPQVRGHDLLGVPEPTLESFFKHDFWGIDIHSDGSHKSFRPVTVMTLRWDNQRLKAGREHLHRSNFHSTVFHETNAVLHVVVCVLFTVVCLQLFQRIEPSLVAGLVYAVHPVHCDAVASIVGRAEVLCGVFFLVTFLAYRQALQVHVLFIQ